MPMERGKRNIRGVHGLRQPELNPGLARFGPGLRCRFLYLGRAQIFYLDPCNRWARLTFSGREPDLHSVVESPKPGPGQIWKILIEIVGEEGGNSKTFFHTHARVSSLLELQLEIIYKEALSFFSYTVNSGWGQAFSFSDRPGLDQPLKAQIHVSSQPGPRYTSTQPMNTLKRIHIMGYGPFNLSPKSESPGYILPPCEVPQWDPLNGNPNYSKWMPLCL